ncbi:MAG: ACT domain-containing protein [Parvibaculaceae bacterium]
MTEPIRDTQAMLAGMRPTLCDGEYVFCTTPDSALAACAAPKALGLFKEEEGTTLILARDDAKTLGFDDALPMRRIVLSVHSALDGVGLTAAVAAALARADIPCNAVAAYHHDHVFVPAALAERALAVLAEVAAEAGA